MSGTSENLLNGLNERQKEAVLVRDGPLLIVAGAGAGKTKTITHRIAHLIESGVPGHSILAVTFTNKAAGEMRERVLRLLGDKPGRGLPLLVTFHALGVRLLREFAPQAGVSANFSIWDRDDSVKAVKKCLEKTGFEWKPSAVLSAISKEKGNGVTFREFEVQAKNFKERGLATVWKEYEGVLEEEGALDFDDLLLKTQLLLSNAPDVLSLLQNRWPYITIDEYQDTNQSQYEIARLLAGERQNICVVGDTDQNIYSWRGADVEHLLSFGKTFPAAKVVFLEQNYRSTRTILTTANAVIEKNVRRPKKHLFTENQTGEPVTLYAGGSEMDEAFFIATTAQELIEKGTKPGEIAVLYRYNFQSRALEEALLSFGLPYKVVGTRFFERKEVKDILSYIRAALNPKSKADFSRIVGVPPRGIGGVTQAKIFEGKEHELSPTVQRKVNAFRDILAQIAHAVDTLPPSESVRFVLEVSGIEKMLKEDKETGDERLANIRELVNLATRYDFSTPQEGIERLLEEAALMSDQDAIDKESGGISLMTVHAAKGLEFDAVFITGLEQGLFPSQREDDGRDEEEERRLFYVAVTRARLRLFLSFAHTRLWYGKREGTLPSEFLSDIDQRLMVYAAPPGERGEYIIR